MKNRLLLTILTTSILLVGSFSAHAGLIIIDGGTAGTIPNGASNDLLNGNVNDLYGTTTRAGYYGADLQFAPSNFSYLVQMTYLGKEASFVNNFVFNGSEIFNTSTSVIGDQVSVVLSGPFSIGDLIPFLFTYNINGSSGTVVNGSNPDDSTDEAPQNFFVTCVDDPNATTCDTIDIFLDDGGAGPDDNHDDIAVRLSLRVPEPATLALLGLGLIGISLSRGRRKA